MSSWRFEKRPEVTIVPVDEKAYNQDIDEITRLLYGYFRQSDSPRSEISLPHVLELPKIDKEFRA